MQQRIVRVAPTQVGKTDRLGGLNPGESYVSLGREHPRQFCNSPRPDLNCVLEVLQSDPRHLRKLPLGPSLQAFPSVIRGRRDQYCRDLAQRTPQCSWQIRRSKRSGLGWRAPVEALLVTSRRLWNPSFPASLFENRSKTPGAESVGTEFGHGCGRMSNPKLRALMTRRPQLWRIMQPCWQTSFGRLPTYFVATVGRACWRPCRNARSLIRHRHLNTNLDASW